MTAARILTVRQPWAWAIIHGGKTVENRVRNISGDYRGPVLIHAAKVNDTDAWAAMGRTNLAAYMRSLDAVESLIRLAPRRGVHHAAARRRLARLLRVGRTSRASPRAREPASTRRADPIQGRTRTPQDGVRRDRRLPRRTVGTPEGAGLHAHGMRARVPPRTGRSSGGDVMNESERICAPNIDRGRGYCGRKNQRTDEWSRVNCADCHAAVRADKEPKR